MRRWLNIHRSQSFSRPTQRRSASSPRCVGLLLHLSQAGDDLATRPDSTLELNIQIKHRYDSNGAIGRYERGSWPYYRNKQLLGAPGRGGVGSKRTEGPRGPTCGMGRRRLHQRTRRLGQVPWKKPPCVCFAMVLPNMLLNRHGVVCTLLAKVPPWPQGASDAA